MLRFRWLRAGFVGATLMALAVPAGAETVSIGTLPSGSLGDRIASAVASAVTAGSDLQARVVNLGGSNVFIAQVAQGDLEFSTSNTVEAEYAYKGTGNFEGKALPDVRMVAALIPFQVGIMVRKDSDFRSLRDLKGQPFPTQYTSQKLVEAFFLAMLKTEGLSVDDFEPVAVPNFVKGAELLAAGKVEGVLLAPGSGIVKRTDAQVPVRFLSLPSGPDAEAKLRSVTPNAYLTEVQPRPGLTGITEPVTLMGYEYTILAGKGVSDETVYRFVKALYEGKEKLAEGFGGFKQFDPSKMAVKLDVPYHPGAQKFYQEVGIWPSD